MRFPNPPSRLALKTKMLVRSGINKMPSWYFLLDAHPPFQPGPYGPTPEKIVYPEDRMRKDFLHIGETALFPYKVHSDDPRWYLTPPDIYAKKQVALMQQGYSKQEAHKIVSKLAMEKEYISNLESNLLRKQAEKVGITTSPYYTKQMEAIKSTYSSIRNELSFEHKVKSREALEILIQRVKEISKARRPKLNQNHLKVFYIPREVLLEHLTMRPEDKTYFDLKSIYGKEMKFSLKQEPTAPVWGFSSDGTLKKGKKIENLEIDDTILPDYLTQKIKQAFMRKMISNPDYAPISTSYEKVLESVINQMNETISTGQLESQPSVEESEQALDEVIIKLRQELEQSKGAYEKEQEEEEEEQLLSDEEFSRLTEEDDLFDDLEFDNSEDYFEGDNYRDNEDMD